MVLDLNEDVVMSLVPGDWPNMQGLALASIIILAAQRKDGSYAGLKVKKQRFVELIGDR